MSAMRKIALLLGAGALLLAGFALLPGPAAAYDIRWGTAPAGGVWQALGTAMVEDVVKANPKLKGSTMPIGGAANVIATNAGKINVAFSFSSTAGEAWDGKLFFKKTGKLRKIRELAVLFPEPTQIMVRKDAGIDQISQLKGKRLTPGPKGSAISVVSGHVLAAYGLSFKDFDIRFLSFSEAGKQFIDGHIDCVFYGAMAFPAPPMVNAASQRKIKLLPLTPAVIAKLVKEVKGLEPYTLPKGSYPGVDYAVPGVIANVVAIASQDMPDAVAYAIVKSIDQNFERYGKMVKAMQLGKRQDMAKNIGIPMHPGAVKYYKEKGWLK
ncbi:MAG: TAXI family TRAP transporter solute-binding subunit [Desulfarculus sp.]|jgi:TRAP transporter TAXI family solute receptor|nr:MAG: TAXI family TRAP transporter solute-binding subunit [Desulfarculus sp.]